jgi:hypothetical protein
METPFAQQQCVAAGLFAGMRLIILRFWHFKVWSSAPAPSIQKVIIRSGNGRRNRQQRP